MKRKNENHANDSPRRLSRRLNRLQDDGTPVRNSARLNDTPKKSTSLMNDNAGLILHPHPLKSNETHSEGRRSARRSISNVSNKHKKSQSKKNYNNGSTKHPQRCSKRLRGSRADDAFAKTITHATTDGFNNSASKKKTKTGLITPPRRFSRRLNQLQKDGSPVRKSLRVMENAQKSSPPRRSLVNSITQSARIPSRTKKKSNGTSCYSLEYHAKRTNDKSISPSQHGNEFAEDLESLNPMELDNEFQHDSNDSKVTCETIDNVDDNVSCFDDKISRANTIPSKTDENREDNDSFFDAEIISSKCLLNLDDSISTDCDDLDNNEAFNIDSDSNEKFTMHDNDSSIDDEMSIDCDYLDNTEAFVIEKESNLNISIQNESNKIENINLKRICYCDKLPIPIDCKECKRSSFVPCDKHTIVYCENEGCGKPMHKGCVATYFGIDMNSMEDGETIQCIKCLSKDNNESEPWDSIDDETKRKRFGLFPEQDMKLVKNMQKILMEECDVPYTIVDDIKNNDPKPHPSVTPITIEREDLHALCGRRFDLSMMMFSIHSCDCCGITKPLHRDRYYPDNAIFERKHFIQSFYKAWHCTCDGYCKGDQYYGSQQRSSIKLYRDNHNGLAPWEFLNLSKKETNALLCKKCNVEIKARNTIDLQFARSFSFRNGYGPAFIYPKAFEGEDPNFIIGRELQEIMTSLTCVEEAAIRQITPLVSLVRLSTGSISMKGNTSCVWQQSKLNIILPNLPTECKFVIIKRKGCTQSTKDIKSTKFERSKIERALELLSGTVDGIWKHSDNFPIQISMDKLNAWPESGNLIDLLSDEEKLLKMKLKRNLTMNLILLMLI